MADTGDVDVLKAPIMKPEDERTDADSELLANALESEKSKVVEAAHEVRTELAE